MTPDHDCLAQVYRRLRALQRMGEPCACPRLQQVYAHDFRYNAQQVRLLLRPESAFPAFIKADVAPGLAVVADHTLQHGLDALRLQNLHLIRGQCMDVAAVKNYRLR